MVNLCEITDANIEKDMSDAKFIKIVFPTLKEARNRAIVLALLTCNPHKPHKTFVQLFTKACFSNDQSDSHSAYNQIRQVRKALFSKGTLSEK